MAIPLTVIGGFLGAGKTTLLNHLLSLQSGHRIALLVNDFGAIHIDAALVRSQNGDTLALSNGCVCCTIGDDLSQALIRVLDATPPFDAVMIEASGVSDPGRIARLAKAAPELEADAVLVLVDASMLLTHWADPLLTDTLQRQCQAADLLILNHIDRATEAERLAARQLLHRQAPGTPVIETVEARLPFELVSRLGLSARPGQEAATHALWCEDFDGPQREGGDVPYRPYQRPWPEPAMPFESWSGTPQRSRTRAEWEARLQALTGSVLRLKGWVNSTDQGRLEVQLAGRQWRIQAALQPAATPGPLVAIGLKGQMPLEALEAL